MTICVFADILHVHAERAPGGRAQFKVGQPLLSTEWEYHQAITTSDYLDDDPEAIS